MAVDRKTIVDKVFQGHAVEGEGYIPPRFGDVLLEAVRRPGGRLRPRQGGRSSSTRRATGRTATASGVGKDGKPLDFRILCHATDPNDKAVGKYLQEWWGELGIGLKVDCLDNVSDPWLRRRVRPRLRRLVRQPGPGLRPVDPHLRRAARHARRTPARPTTSSATSSTTTLYAKQLAEYDPAKRADLVKQMESRLYDTGYMNVMAYPNAVEAYRTDQIKSITTMPEAAGNIYGQDGYWSWWSAVPAAGASGGSGSTAPSTGVIIGCSSAPASSWSPSLGGGSCCRAVRRRSTAEDRE